MFLRSRIALSVAVAGLIASAPASAASQRNYKIRGGTTTITLHNAWMGILQSAGVEVSAGQGAHFSVTKPGQGAAPIYRITLPMRKPARTDSSNLLVYGTSQGTLFTLNHAGAITLRSTDSPGKVTFLRPVFQLADPEISRAANRMDAVLARSTPRGTEPIIRTGRVRIPKPSGGDVTIRMKNVRFDCSSGLLNGTDPESPAGSADWFPSAARGVMADIVTVLRVTRMR